MSEMSRKTDDEHENGLGDVERIAFCCILCSSFSIEAEA
jgi:hypothetical protein